MFTLAQFDKHWNSQLFLVFKQVLTSSNAFLSSIEFVSSARVHGSALLFMVS